LRFAEADFAIAAALQRRNDSIRHGQSYERISVLRMRPASFSENPLETMRTETAEPACSQAHGEPRPYQAARAVEDRIESRYNRRARMTGKQEIHNLVQFWDGKRSATDPTARRSILPPWLLKVVKFDSLVAPGRTGPGLFYVRNRRRPRSRPRRGARAERLHVSRSLHARAHERR